MPNINIDDAYILGETGAQVDKVTGLFTKDEGTTSGEKAFAQLNIGTAGSNRNLLDNPWWGLNEVINQRGNTSGQTTHDAYSIDRWKMSHGSARGSWSIAEDGITITAASGTYALFGQVLANKDAIEGKTVTASVLLGDGTIVSGTIPSFTWATNPIAYEHNGLQLRFLASGTFRVNVTDGNSKTIRAVKLELGSVSTLANDVPPDYGEELSKCQRYFLRIYGDPIGTGYISSGLGTAFILVPTGVTMRAKPTASYSGAFSVRLQGSTIGVSAMTFATPAHTGGGVGIVCTLSSNAGSVGACALYANQTTNYIDLSADL